jgi:hypothetical protein
VSPRLRSGVQPVLAVTAALILVMACSDRVPTAVDSVQEAEDIGSLAPSALLTAVWSGGPVLVSVTGLDFSDVQVGTTSPPQDVKLVNVSTENVVVSLTGGAAGVFGGVQDCEGTSLAPGASCTLSYAFAPTEPGDATFTTSGTVNGDPFEIELRGRGVAPRFRITGTALDFGYVQLGTSVQLPVTLTNIGLAAVVGEMTGGAAGAFGGFTNCHQTPLNVGDSCQLTYTFMPTAAGEATGSTSGTMNGQPFGVTMRGIGVAPSFRVTPTSIDFGEVVVGSTLQQVVRITNTSTNPVTGEMTGGAAGPFGGVQNCHQQPLAPGASCELTYTYAPTATGEVTGSTGGTMNGQPYAVTFRGVGIASEAARTLQFRVSRRALDFGNVQVGHSQQLIVDVVNAGPTSTVVSMTGGAAGPFGGVQNCHQQTLAPGAACQITYTFAPTEPGLVTGSTGGTLNGEPFSITMQGTGVPARFRVSPTRLSFGQLQVGTSLQQVVTVTNVGTNGAVVEMTGGAAGAFGGVQNCHLQTLVPGASCELTYTFQPTAAGLATGTTGGTLSGQAFALEMSGEGLAPRFRNSPFRWDFGPVEVGATAEQAVILTNVGIAPVVGAITGGAAGVFGGVQNCEGTPLAIGGSCSLAYTFAPTEPGLVTGSTSGTLNGQPFAFSMRGTGGGLVASPYAFIGFAGPVVARSAVKAGSTATVLFEFGYADGTPLSPQDAEAFVSDCKVRLVFSAEPSTWHCARVDEDGRFAVNLKLPKDVVPGMYSVTVELLDEQWVLATGTLAIEIR